MHEAPVIKLSHVFLGTLSLFFCLVVYCCVCLLSTGDTGYITGYPVLLAKALLMYVVGYFLSFYAGGGRHLEIYFYCFCGFGMCLRYMGDCNVCSESWFVVDESSVSIWFEK